MGKYSSKQIYQDPKLLRNDYESSSFWGIPTVKKCTVDISKINLIGCDKISKKPTELSIFQTVHFFVEDYKFNRYYDNYSNYLVNLAKYEHVLTPDFSLYPEMPKAMQIYNTFRNRWCGAYWQEHGLSVIPTVGWSTSDSFDFCFDGIEYGSVVAVSTLGCSKARGLFLEGYFEMKDRINPKQILCYHKAFPEMGDEVFVVNYPTIIRRAN